MARSQSGNKFRKPPVTALLSYSTDKNMCKGAIEFQDECGLRTRQPALFMNASYYCNLRNYATEHDREIAEMKRKEQLKDLENSKILSKNWWDTPENLKIANEKKRQDQKKKYEEESEIILREMEIANREKDRKILSDAKAIKFNAREDIKELHAACLVSEVLNEQAAQVKFNEKIKRLREEREKKYYDQDMKAICEYFENEANKAAERRKADLEYGRKLMAQINSRNKIKCELETEEREREQKFNAIMQAHDDKVGENKQKKIEEYIRNLKNGQLMQKFIEEERQRDDELEEQQIKNYQDSVTKLKEALKGMKNEKLLALKERSDVAVAQLNVFKKKLLEREAKERECMERDAKIFIERQEQRALDDEARRKRLAAEFLADNIQQRREVEAKKKDESLMKNLDRLRAMKVDEDCKQAKEVKEHLEIKKKTIARAILKEQMDFREMKDKEEKGGAGKYLEEIRKIQNKEDEEFWAYACSMINKSRAHCRDIRPMEKVIKKFCQRRKSEN